MNVYGVSVGEWSVRAYDEGTEVGELVDELEELRDVVRYLRRCGLLALQVLLEYAAPAAHTYIHSSTLEIGNRKLKCNYFQ